MTFPGGVFPSATTFPAAGGTAAPVATRISVPYLGRPGAMVQLPSPNGPITAAPSFNDSVRTLASGAVSVNRRLFEKKTHSLPFVGLSESEAGVIFGFYRRLYGSGPFAFVDPSVTNMLPLDVSTCGVRSQAPHGWYASTGGIARLGAPPTGVGPTGVLRWTPAVNATLTACMTAAALQTLTAPVYLPTEAVTVSLYVSATSAVPLTLVLAGFNAAGTLTSTSLTSSATVTTTFSRLTVTAPVGAASLSGCAYVTPMLQVGTTAPTSIWVAAAQVEYATVLSDWQQGAGTPRVLPSAAPGRDVQQAPDFPTDHTFTLAEAV